MKKLIGLLALLAMFACPVFAVTNDLSVGSGALPAGRPGAVWITLPTVSLATTAATAADYYTVMNIPAGAVIHAVWFKASTAAGATCTIDIGDTGSDTRFVTAGDIEVTTAALTDIAVIPAYYYATANSLRVQINNSNSTAVFVVKVLVSMP